MKKKSAILTAPKTFKIVEEDIPALQPHEILIEVEAIGLCHSDMPTYLGTSGFGVDEYGHLAMTEVNFPTIAGHETVGIVSAVGEAVEGFEVGDYVSGSGLVPGFSTHCIAPAMLCIKIPKELPREDLKYCLAEPLSCVGGIVQVANPALGDTISVVGCGMMGLLTIAGLKHSGAKDIIAVDVDDSRLEKAKEMGATKTINPIKENVTVAIDALTNGKGADIVVEITGSLRGLKTALKTAKYADFLGEAGRGKVLIPSLYAHKEEWDPEIGYELAGRGVILHSIHPPYLKNYMKTAEDSVEAFVKGILPLKELITHEFSLEDIKKGFECMENKDMSYLKGIVIPK